MCKAELNKAHRDMTSSQGEDLNENFNSTEGFTAQPLLCYWGKKEKKKKDFTVSYTFRDKRRIRTGVVFFSTAAGLSSSD